MNFSEGGELSTSSYKEGIEREGRVESLIKKTIKSKTNKIYKPLKSLVGYIIKCVYLFCR
jgi:uncharacterized protein (UPF0297 family)